MNHPPRSYAFDGAFVIVPGRVAALLERRLGLDKARIEQRGLDAEVDQVLADLHIAALRWRTSAVGSSPAPQPEVEAVLPWVSTAEAALSLGITDRAVRLAIQQQRVPARQIDGRWRITREDVEHYRVARRVA